MRSQIYIFLQRLKFFKCGRILGSNAQKNKNGNIYYYYQYHDCKISIKETDIEKEFDNFINEIQEYDSVVNQALLPMIKTKFNNSKSKLVKKLNEQNQKFERIKKAYINCSFTIEEYANEKADYKR